MAEQTELQVQRNLTAEQQTVIAKKSESWKIFGAGLAQTEIELTEDAESISKRIATLPTTIGEIPVAEVTLKNSKSAYLRLMEHRKKVTQVLDKLTARLMTYEQSLVPKMTAYYDATVSVKSAYEKAQAAVKEKTDEIKRIKEYLLNEVNAFDAECKTKIATLISSAYKYALGAGNISKVDQLAEYLLKVQTKLEAKDFIYNPKTPTLVHIGEEEYAEMVSEINIPTDYVALFHEDLKKQFSFYEVDWNNKEAALKIQKDEEAKKQAAIAEELANKNVAAKLDAIAQTPVAQVAPGVKALKKTFAIDMVDNEQNALVILSAFIANYHKCYAKIRIKKAFNLSIGNMILSLESVKNEDNVFECTGIIWKEVSKL